MDAIDRIRAFNRAHTKRIGLLEQGYLTTDRSLPELRVLFELSDQPGRSARALAEGLGLNEGYLSRMLAGLEAEGLVTRVPSDTDKRIRVPELTEQGRAQVVDLIAASRRMIGTWFEDAGPTTPDRVAWHLSEAERLISGDDRPVELRHLAPGDAGWLIQQHAELYARDEGFDASFEALVARILADFIDSHDPACERA